MNKLYKYFVLTLAIMWILLLPAYIVGIFEPSKFTVSIAFFITILWLLKEYRDEE